LFTALSLLKLFSLERDVGDEEDEMAREMEM
jgi:hypothetical protein